MLKPLPSVKTHEFHNRDHDALNPEEANKSSLTVRACLAGSNDITRLLWKEMTGFLQKALGKPSPKL